MRFALTNRKKQIFTYIYKIADMRTFTISDSEEEKLKEWQEKIKDLFGEYGHYDYVFSPNGVYTWITVKSHLTKTEIDLTDYDKI